MKIPTTLKHKPVIVAENYDSIDGRGAYHSDAKGLSLGLAQWNDRGKVDISAKVWRHTGEKWSRQSEELPMHRVLDLAILLCRTNLYFRDEAYRHPRYYDPEHPRIDRVGLQGDAMDIEGNTAQFTAEALSAASLADFPATVTKMPANTQSIRCAFCLTCQKICRRDSTLRIVRCCLKYARKIPCWKKISACFTMCWARTASCWASDFPFWPGCCGRWDIDS